MSLPESEQTPPLDPQPAPPPPAETTPAPPTPEELSALENAFRASESSERASAARRRRARRGAVPQEVEQRASYFRELVHKATPSADFFLFSAIAGVTAGAALLLDAPALYVLAALLAPFMAPVLGLAVAAAIGNMSFFLRSLMALLIGAALVFALGAITGLIGQTLTGLTFTQAVLHASYNWADLLVVVVGAAITALLAVRVPQRPLVSSVALAYELFLPLAVAGFGLTYPQAGLFPAGLELFGMHLALACATAALVMVLAGVRPLPSGARWLVSLFLLAVLVGATLLGASGLLAQEPTPTAMAAPATATPRQSTATVKATQAGAASTPNAVTATSALSTPTLAAQASAAPTSVAGPTATPTNTLVPTLTPTITLTPSPTPVYAMVNAGDLNGVIVRPDPGSMQIVTTLLNGSLLELLPETVNKNGFFWLHVRTTDGKEGWVQQGLLMTATARPK